MREKRDVGRVEWFERRARELAGSGKSGTSTPVEKAAVVADVMEQLDTTDAAPVEQEPKLTRRQARSREGKKELAKFKTEKAEPVRPATPVVVETNDKRRKVRVPYVEDGPQGGPVLDLIVNGDGTVLLVSRVAGSLLYSHRDEADELFALTAR